jgi:hypothetical protein
MGSTPTPTPFFLHFQLPEDSGPSFVVAPKSYGLTYRGQELAEILRPGYGQYCGENVTFDPKRPPLLKATRYLSVAEQASVLAGWADLLTNAGHVVYVCMPIERAEDEDDSYVKTHLWRDGWVRQADCDPDWIPYAVSALELK